MEIKELVSKDYRYHSYWLSPEGVLHKVPFVGHSQFYLENILASQSHNLWVKISCGKIYRHQDSIRFTTDQQETLLTWCLLNEFKLDEWLSNDYWNYGDFEEYVEAFRE